MTMVSASAPPMIFKVPDRALIAHLLRRAGFGATPAELEKYSSWGYDATVEWLLHPEAQPGLDEDIIERYYIDWKESRNIEGALTETVYRMNGNAAARPLQEKSRCSGTASLPPGWPRCCTKRPC